MHEAVGIDGAFDSINLCSVASGWESCCVKVKAAGADAMIYPRVLLRIAATFLLWGTVAGRGWKSAPGRCFHAGSKPIPSMSG